MSAVIVVDACVALSWVLPHTEDEDLYGRRVAEQGLRRSGSLIAPTVMLAECGHALLRRARALRWHRDRIEGAAELIETHRIRLRGSDALLTEQVDFALEHHVQGFDSFYLALALAARAPLATIDNGLRAAARRLGVELFN